MPAVLMMMDQEQQEKLHQQQQQQQSGADVKSKRNPYCSRCRNHGKIAQVKGHKRHCEYRHCQCEGCKLVECRQIVSAAQIKRRRYQKQDEECGRRIEISPPVLTRTANSECSATLIAKTLLNSKQNSSTTKHFAAAVAAAAAADVTSVSAAATAVSQHAAAAAQQQHQQQLHMQMTSMPAAFVDAVASSAPTTSLTSAWPQHTPPSSSVAGGRSRLPVTSTCPHLLHMGAGDANYLTPTSNHHHLGSTMASRLAAPLAPNGALIMTSGAAAPLNQQQQQQHHHHQHQLAPNSHLLDQTQTGGSPNLRDALHLFHFHPNSMFTGAAFGQPGGLQLRPSCQLSAPQAPHQQAYSQLSCNNNSNNNSPPTGLLKANGTGGAESAGVAAGALSSSNGQLPEHTTAPSSFSSPEGGGSGGGGHSPREQLNLVKEIHRSFGPLIVYAWLRSERFDVAKVRALIDMAEDSFDELLQANGHSPLDLTSPIVD